MSGGRYAALTLGTLTAFAVPYAKVTVLELTRNVSMSCRVQGTKCLCQAQRGVPPDTSRQCYLSKTFDTPGSARQHGVFDFSFCPMSRYRRNRVPGGTYFFTLVLADRPSSLLTREIDLLRRAWLDVSARHPFETLAVCILPDHLHAIWRLPEGDADYSLRWNQIKGGFSRHIPPKAPPVKNTARRKHIWQRRFWEHTIRDDKDMQAHVDYIHFNPVRHGLVSRVREWPHSSFHRFVRQGLLSADWGGDGTESHNLPSEEWD